MTFLAGWIAGAAAAAAASAMTVPLPSPGPEAEAVYLERFRAMATSPSGELPAYAPLEPVPGDHRPLPRGDPALPRAVLDAMDDWAAGQDSSALLVWHDGALVHERHWGERRRLDPIVSKSLAKPLTAIAIGRAIALGAIASLDQPVADFVPEWRGTPRHAMLVRHLLDMRSGLLAQGFEPDPASIWARAYLHPFHEHVLVHDYPLTDPPGTVYEYSNATSDLVALVIERATGRRYAEFLSAEIFRPLGAAGGELWVNRPGGLAHSGCCLLAPPEDFLRLGVLLAQDGMWQDARLLPPGFVEAMRQPTSQNPHAGLGVYVAGPYIERRGFANPARPGRKVLHGEPYRAADLFLFDGNANQAVWIVPSARLVVLRTGEWGRSSGPDEWDNSRLPNLALEGLGVALEPQPRD